MNIYRGAGRAQLYFAYGSCMDFADIFRTDPAAVFVGTAVLKNHKLAFSRYSLSRRGGVADIVREPGEYVEGVLYEVPDFALLDRREGAPFFYRRMRVRVYPAWLGGRWKWAWTYEIVDKSPVEIAPSREYALLIWEGAKVLSLEYRKRLRENLLRKDRVKIYDQTGFDRQSGRKVRVVEEGFGESRGRTVREHLRGAGRW